MYTLDDFDLSDKKCLLRVDINSPFDNGKLLDTTRMESHIPTIERLRGSPLVIIAHQGRPGSDDFTSLEEHSRVLSRLLKYDVSFSDGLFERVRDLGPSEVLLLENIRFFSEEGMKLSPGRHAEGVMVKKLSPLFDLFVNDAFAAAHRGNASIVGFPQRLPSAAGLLMEREVRALDKALAGENSVFILGGAKIDDSLRVMENVLKKGICEKVLTTGLVGNVFLSLENELGAPNLEILKASGMDSAREYALKLSREFGDRIEIPSDIAISRDGERVEVDLSTELTDPVLDIGHETIDRYTEFIELADVNVFNGPAGRIESSGFKYGTECLLKAMASSSGYSVVGGGHSAILVRTLGIEISHLSSGGGACIEYLSGAKLPGIEALKTQVGKPL